MIKLNPERIWKYFDELTLIPRPSGKEERVVRSLLAFAKRENLEALKDNTGNVVVRKAAFAGMEHKKTIVLQSHVDMVPQKNSDKEHDFEKDPIETIIDGDWVKADGTTLGADNGIGVATMLALLESNDIPHGPLECLFTVDEETGMTGAFGLESDVLHGDILLNLDSEEEGELIIGCAGGEDLSACFNYNEKDINRDELPYKVTVKGLRGGHSGIDIHLGRGNAIQIISRFLWEATQKFNVSLATLQGGSLRNAIPREAFAEVLVPAKSDNAFQDYAREFSSVISSELSRVEPTLVFDICPTGSPASGIPAEIQGKLLNVIEQLPDGVINMDMNFKGVVETSTNLAIIECKPGKINLHCLLRSSVDSAKNHLANRMQSLLALAGAEVNRSGAYPGWKPNPGSQIVTQMKKIYKNRYGKEPEVKVIHAGLECGIIGSKYPRIEMVSFGPTICHPHSPDEKVNIPSVQKFWDYLLEVLKNAPEKNMMR